MIQVFLAVVIVLAVPATDYHLEYMARTTTGKALIRAAIRCIKKDGYFEVHDAPDEAEQFIYVSCYLPDPVESVVVEETDGSG